MKSIKLKTPLDEATVRKLRIGDIVFLSGRVYTMRDKATERALKTKAGFLKNSVVYHCGPLVKKKGGKWSMVSAGPTTSSRMNAGTPALLKKFGVRAVIGKSGMNAGVLKAMRGRCVYLAAVGGCGALYARSLRVRGVRWLDLGMPEAVWELDAKEFGPLVVAMDSHGKTLFKKRG